MLSSQHWGLQYILHMNHSLLTAVSPYNSPLVSWYQPGWSAGSHRAQCDPDYGSSSGAPVRRLWSGGSCPARSPPDGREHRGRCRGVWCHHQWSAHSVTDSTGTQWYQRRSSITQLSLKTSFDLVLVNAIGVKYKLTRTCKRGQWIDSWMRVPSVIWCKGEKQQMS